MGAAELARVPAWRETGDWRSQPQTSTRFTHIMEASSTEKHLLLASSWHQLIPLRRSCMLLRTGYWRPAADAATLSYSVGAKLAPPIGQACPLHMRATFRGSQRSWIVPG